MAEFKCGACGASFPSEEALKSHARKIISEESVHYRKMSAHGQGDPVYPGVQERPS